MKDNQLVEPKRVSIFKPGVNYRQTSAFTTALEIAIPEDFDDSDSYTSPNDIAFILLADPIATAVPLTIADPDMTTEILDSLNYVQVYGYGRLNPSTHSDIPNYYNASILPNKRLRGYDGYEHTYFTLSNDQNGATCPGDSGGPVIAQYNNQTYLIGVHSGGRGPCNESGTGSWGTTETIAGYYLYLFDEIMETFKSLTPTPVSNLRLVIKGPSGILAWDAPTNSPRKISGYEVYTEDADVLCRTTNVSCEFNFSKSGKNVFNVIALSNEFKSEPMSLEALITNAAPPEVLSVDTLKYRAFVKWATVHDIGNANPASIVVRISDNKNGQFLCEDNIETGGCFFEFQDSIYNLHIEIETNLGISDSIFIQRFSGIIENSLINRITDVYSSISLSLIKLKLKNPGYASEIDRLTIKLPTLDENFVYSNAEWQNGLELQNQLNQLTIKTISKPKSVKIRCVKGSVTKTISGISPKCPAGYKQR